MQAIGNNLRRTLACNQIEKLITNRVPRRAQVHRVQHIGATELDARDAPKEIHDDGPLLQSRLMFDHVPIPETHRKHYQRTCDPSPTTVSTEHLPIAYQILHHNFYVSSTETIPVSSLEIVWKDPCRHV